jgi:tetratricopeptide (TPR) repeat protein
MAAGEPAGTGTVSRGVGMVEAYQDLLRENLDLRNRARMLEEQGVTARRDRERLEAGIRELENKLVEAAAALQKARDAQTAAGDSAALEARVKAAEADRNRLTVELAAARAELAAAASPTPPQGLPVTPGSDIFRKVEAERAALQQRVKTIEAERDSAVREAEALRTRLAALQAELDQLRADNRTQGTEREAMKKLVPHVRRLQERQQELEKQVEICSAERDAALERSEQLDERVKDLSRLANRLLAKTRGAPLDGLDGASGDPSVPSADTGAGRPRDAYHSLFRAGATLTDRSQARLAIKAYQRALKLRPDAAEAHYNLGVLYEQEMNNPRKAIYHYGEYLRLAPDAPDADQVRAWLMDARVRI